MKGFNPRSRARGDRQDTMERLHHNHWPVSIHAPARGATLVVIVLHMFIFVSIHAPARGSDHEALMVQYTICEVSIHAPARGDQTFLSNFSPTNRFNPRSRATGATRNNSCKHGRIGVSIHAPARGRRTLHNSSALLSTSLFQSTLPRGERQHHLRHTEP